MEAAVDEVGRGGCVLSRVRVVAFAAFEPGGDAVPGHEPHDAFGAYPDALVAQHAPYPAVPVALAALLERGPDRCRAATRPARAGRAV